MMDSTLRSICCHSTGYQSEADAYMGTQLILSLKLRDPVYISPALRDGTISHDA